MSTAGTPMGEGMMPSEREERRHETYHRTYREGDGLDKETAEIITGGSTIEVIAGAGAVTLGILGLAGVLPIWFVAISIIAVGAGLMFAGGSIAAKYRDVLSSTGGRHARTNLAETGGGISAETVGGAAGVALGILSLVGVLPFTLNSIGIIVLGGAMAFGSGATKRLSNVVIEASGAPMHKQRVAAESVKGAAAMQLVAGLGAATLGILSLVGIGAQLTLNLIAVLGLGGGLLLSGLAVGGELITTLYGGESEEQEYRGREYRGSDYRGEYRQSGHSPAE